jgi:hypothetical protein
MPKNRSVLAIRSVRQRRQCSDVNALTIVNALTDLAHFTLLSFLKALKTFEIKWVSARLIWQFGCGR